MIILSFIVTALYDVLLRFMVEGRVWAPEWLRSRPWFKSLKSYFQQQTLLAAAAVAGVVGAVTNVVILQFAHFPTTWGALGRFLLLTFVISGIGGIAMRASGLFPILDRTMYDELSSSQEIWADAISGVVVNMSIFILRMFVM